MLQNQKLKIEIVISDKFVFNYVNLRLMTSIIL